MGVHCITKMRLNVKKAIGVGVACLLLWVIFTYFSFANSPLGTKQDGRPVDWREKNLYERVERLEKALGSQLEDNKETLLNIKKMISEKKAAAVHKGSNELKKDGPTSNKYGVIIPVLVMACNRITVSRCLDQLIKYRPDKEQFPIIISQDCNHAATRSVLETYASPVENGISLVMQPDLAEVSVPPREKKFRGYFHIARHYQFALNHTFHVLGYDAVIIVEDDLDIAPDFYEYFLGTYQLLQKDPTLWCVSAWNDNGKPGLVDPNAAELLHRSDFFPGLGWMLRKQLWEELQPKWPKAYWDDWIRKPEQRMDRACIRPELSRTRTFGKVGVSNGLFFEKHLKLIQLSQQSVSFTKLNLTYLMREPYDKAFSEAVYSAPVVSLTELRNGGGSIASKAPAAVRIPYSNKDQYKRTAKQMGLMDDFRSGVGRTAYLGVVSCFYSGRRVFIAPETPQTKYDPTWS